MTTKEMIKRILALGFRKEDIAARVGVSVTSIFRWEKGTTPHMSFKKKIEEYMKEIEARVAKGGK